MLDRLELRDSPLQVLMGTNEDEGSKSLMYFLPQLFPNEELDNPSLTEDKFNQVVERVFADSVQQVPKKPNYYFLSLCSISFLA